MPRTRIPAALCALAALAGACKNERPAPGTSSSAVSDPPAQASGDAALVLPPVDAGASPAVRERNSLRVEERGGAYELADGAGAIKLVLPTRPVVEGRVIDQEGVEVFHAQAVMKGAAGAVDAEVSLISILDGKLPPLLLELTAAIPDQLASATGGKVAANEPTTLGGAPARRFEVVTPDGRRLFGWHINVEAQARVLQVNCVGPDTAASRTACEAIARSVALR